MPRACQTAAALLALSACASGGSLEDTAAWADNAAGDEPTVGWDVGDVVPNLALLDQDGDVVSLYEHTDAIIVLELFAAWCTTCQKAAPELEQLWLEHADQGLVVLSPMMEAPDGQLPQAADVAAWAERYALERPVLVGNDSVGFQAASFPTYVVIDRNMVVRHPDLWPLDEDYLEALLLTR